MPGPENPVPPIEGAYDAPGKNDAVDQAGLFAKISGVAHSALEKAGGAVNSAKSTVRKIIHKGRGRPKKDGSPGAGDLVEEIVEPGGLENPENPDQPVPSRLAEIFKPGLIRRCVAGILKGVLAFPNAYLEAMAVQKGYSPIEAEKLISKAAPQDDELDGLAEFSEIMLREVQIDPKYQKYIPAIAAGSIGLGIVGRYGAIMATLKRKPDVAS